MKNSLLIKAMVGFALLLTSCNSSQPASTFSLDNSSKESESIANNEDQRYEIYLLAVASGYDGTYEEWLESIHGEDGHSPVITINDQGYWCIDGVSTGVRATPEEVYHTVTFDTGGGNTIPSQTVKHGEKVTKPEIPTKVDPVKGEYTFKQWLCQGEPWSFIGYTVTEDITLVAEWVNKYTITFDTQGGTPVPNQYVDEGGRVTEPEIIPTINHGVFLDWSLPYDDNHYDVDDGYGSIFERLHVHSDLVFTAFYRMENSTISLWHYLSTSFMETYNFASTVSDLFPNHEYYQGVAISNRGSYDNLLTGLNLSFPSGQAPDMFLSRRVIYAGEGENPYGSSSENTQINDTKTYCLPLDSTTKQYAINHYQVANYQAMLIDGELYGLPLFSYSYNGLNPNTNEYDVPMINYISISIVNNPYGNLSYDSERYQICIEFMKALSDYYQTNF